MRSHRLFRVVASSIVSPEVIFGLALAVRIFVLMHLLPEQADRGFYRGNEAARIAWAMVSGHGFSSPWPNTPLAPSAQQPPLYPVLLAGIFKLAGTYSHLSLWIAVILNAVFSAITAVFIFVLGKRVFGASVGIIAAWIWACWLPEAVVSIRLWESSLSALFLIASLYLLLYLRDSRHWFSWWLFGLLGGISALTNTTLLPLFFFFLIWLWFVGWKCETPRTQQIWGAAAICLLVLLPWTLRNYSVFQRVIPVRDNFGMELWIGNHEGVTNLFEYTSGFPLIDPGEYNRLGEIQFMEEKQRVAFQFIKDHPAQFLRLCGQRFFYFWTSPYRKTWFAVSLASWLGMILALVQRKILAVPFAIVLLLFPIVYYVTHPWSTYRHPIEPVMILLATNLAVCGVRWLAEQVAGNSLSR